MKEVDTTFPTTNLNMQTIPGFCASTTPRLIVLKSKRTRETMDQQSENVNQKAVLCPTLGTLAVWKTWRSSSSSGQAGSGCRWSSPPEQTGVGLSLVGQDPGRRPGGQPRLGFWPVLKPGDWRYPLKPSCGSSTFLTKRVMFETHFLFVDYLLT